MPQLSASEILAVWERGAGRPPGELALELLDATGHPDSPDAVALGDRDAALLALRVDTFGTTLAATATCPECDEQLDVEVAASDVRAAGGAPAQVPIAVSLADGTSVHVRPATAADVVAAAATGEVEAGRAVLLERCVLDRDSAALDPAAARAVAKRLTEADPGARTDVALICPACHNAFAVPFDIVAFLWAEIDARARRLLREVHVLASAYGWPEREVLALTAARRAAYLDLASA